jgi:hypothetical protein
MLPLHGYIGYGGGMYEGPFAGLNWSVMSRLMLILEYTNKLELRDSYQGSGVFNADARFNLTDSLRGDISLVDLKHVGYGLAYSVSL